MKQRTQGVIAGILIGAVCTGGAVFAKSGAETIEAVYDNIKIFIDGEQLDPRDANGQPVEPFIYNGTTYLPVRAVGEAIGKDVSWDGVEKVVYLGAKPGEAENWLSVCGPYQYTHGEEYRLADNKYFTMSGQKYTDGFVLEPNDWYDEKAEALFNLNGQYSSLTFTAGHIDGSGDRNATLNIYLDGIIAYTTELSYDDVAKPITVPLNNALQMKIEVVGIDLNVNIQSSVQYGFSEGVFS